MDERKEEKASAAQMFAFGSNWTELYTSIMCWLGWEISLIKYK